MYLFVVLKHVFANYCNKGSQATQVGSHGIEASTIFEIFLTECQLDDNYQEVVIIQWYLSYHPALSFDVWLHWNRRFLY